MNDFWRDCRVLVTGATGLVGSWLVRELLSRGAHVVTLIRDMDPQSELMRSGDIRSVTVTNGRIENYPDVERSICTHEIDTVFHLGAQTIVGTAFRSPRETFESNVRGTWNVLDACRMHSSLVKRVVVASSDKAYGIAETLPYTEELPLVGRFPYDCSKSCADLIAQSYWHTYELPVVIARCGNIYGGGDLNWSRIVPGAIRSLHRGERPVIRSDGRYTRDYVYVRDAVAAYLLLAEALDRPEVRGQAFNFGPARPYAVCEIVELLGRLMQRDDLQPIVLNNAKAEIRHQYLCSTKATRLLEWRPAYAIDRGLEETIAWYRGYFATMSRTSVCAFQESR